MPNTKIILRYVGCDNLVNECPSTLLDAKKSAGEYYLQLLKDVLQREGIESVIALAMLLMVLQTRKESIKIFLHY